MHRLVDEMDAFCQAFIAAVLKIRGVRIPAQEDIDSAAAVLSTFFEATAAAPSDSNEDRIGHQGLRVDDVAEHAAFLYMLYGVPYLSRAEDDQVKALTRWRTTGELPRKQ